MQHKYAAQFGQMPPNPIELNWPLGLTAEKPRGMMAPARFQAISVEAAMRTPASFMAIIAAFSDPP
jgi:hypothetical protein